MKSLGIALLGFGGIARSHIQGWRDLPLHYGLPASAVRIVGVATRSERTAHAAAVEIECPIATTDARALVSRDDVDIVDICAPMPAHLALVRIAAEAGKHIYLEKPIATSLAEAHEIAAVIGAAGVKCQVTFNYRWIAAPQRMKALIDDGFVGPITSVRGRYFRSSHADPTRVRTWRHVFTESGGGAWADLGSHVIDLVAWLAGPISKIMAMSRTVIGLRPVAPGSSELGAVDTDDETLALIRLASGATGTLEISRVAVGASNDLLIEIIGERGALRFSLEDLNWLYAYDGTVTESRRGWTRLETIQRYPGAMHPEWTAAAGVARGHAESQYQFAQAIWEDRPSVPGVETGLAVQAVIEAGYTSARVGRWTAVEASR